MKRYQLNTEDRDFWKNHPELWNEQEYGFWVRWEDFERAERQRDEAVKALRETAESLCKCRRVMMEAIKDFHGKSVLFSSSFLITAEDLEKPERIP